MTQEEAGGTDQWHCTWYAYSVLINYEKSDAHQYLNTVRSVTENNNNCFISIYSSFLKQQKKKPAGWLN